jgi:hypothetical protein
MIFYKGNTPIGHSMPKRRTACLNIRRIERLVRSRCGDEDYYLHYWYCVVLKKEIHKRYCRDCKNYIGL